MSLYIYEAVSKVHQIAVGLPLKCSPPWIVCRPAPYQLDMYGMSI